MANILVKQKILSLMIGAAATALGTQALAEITQPSNTSPENVDEIIVTGTPNGEGIKKLDASFSITTVNADAIQQVSPASSADLLKTIPGVSVESSGGVSGPNIFVRGLPSTSDADYITISINGMPTYNDPTLSFMDNSTLFRIDSTIDHLEALRGGPSPVFSNGQVGLTTNFILKEGGDTNEGSISYSTSDYNLHRFDGVYSGKLAEDFYYMIGGYVSSSPGVRDAGYEAEQGHQFTINLTKKLENGKLNLWNRSTNDYGTWYLPQMLDTAEIKTGLKDDYTQVGPRNRQATILASEPDGNGGSVNRPKHVDLGDGRGWNGDITGGSVELELADGWNFADRFSLTKGQVFTHGLVRSQSARLVSSITTSPNVTTVSGAPVATTDVVQLHGPWIVEKDIKDFNNDISLSKKWDGFKLTLGQYSAVTSAKDNWAIGKFKWYQLKHDGEQLDPASIPDVGCQAADQVSCDWSYDLNATGNTHENAFYAAGQIFMDEWTFDVGARTAKRETNYSNDNGSLDGKINHLVEATPSYSSYTAAANWNFSDTMGVFARINHGYQFPDLDDYRSFYSSYEAGSDLLLGVQQAELGFKFSEGNYSLFATLFSNTTEGQAFCTVGGGVCTRLETEALGLELDGKIKFGGFSLDLNGTFLDAEVTKDNAAASAEKGNAVPRQPGVMLRLTPSYVIDMDGMSINLYGTLSRIGERDGDYANNDYAKLPAYTKGDVGVIVDIDKMNFQLSVDNVSNVKGRTEYDPRATDGSQSARLIYPRNIKFTLGYKF
jgi:iron complex outermembrane recepter protein